MARAIRLLQIAVNPTLLRRQCDEFNLPALELRDNPLQMAIEYYAKYEIPDKIALTCDLARETCSKGNKIIIWSTFVHNLSMVANLLREFNPVIIHGGVILSSDKDEITRESLIAKFKNDPTCFILIANPAACAESISLHKVCHHAIYLDRSFNCTHYIQSLDRIHRLGLSPSQHTYYHLMLAEGSIDEVVHNRLKEKMRNMRQVIEGDLPRDLPGYWSEDLGDEEEVDYDLVESHIKQFVSSHASKT